MVIKRSVLVSFILAVLQFIINKVPLFSKQGVCLRDFYDLFLFLITVKYSSRVFKSSFTSLISGVFSIKAPELS